ncbi:Fe(3+)-hydroxamate ABC transporter permease FhuB [Chitinasiproducens palmae]|uniref:Iron complex transport system permease protein n=1 Tax=Chitinasiproducens palmae TaxID=1770053 RepID=A0A1H2PIH5_9BURK|nr:Fe(3+)-hydroxamate ABC transporter permease FhuB [Chitinasiproducens palmae]SDV46045.1 iron complex transport system permease protein [Chitinasiproducens palmae]
MSSVTVPPAAHARDRSPWPFAVALLLAAVVATWLNLHRALPASGWRGLLPGADPDDMQRVVILYSFLPRLAVSLIAGVALSVAGALFQHVLRNPLAEPTTLGVAAGASLAMTLSTLWFPAWLLVHRDVIALAGAVLAFGVVFAIAWAHALSPLVLILAGLIVTLCAGSIASVLALFFNQGLLGVFLWQSGALNQNSWDVALTLLPRVAVGIAITALLVKPLSVMAVGDDAARALGVSLRGLRLVALLFGTLLSAWIVSALGVIGFVGLAGPALARLNGARTLGRRVTWGAIIGALLLWLADQAVQPFPFVPTGVATALLGAPLLLWLLRQLHDTPATHRHDGPVRISAARRPLMRVLIAFAGLACLALAAVLVSRGVHGWRIDTPGSLGRLAELRVPRVLGALAAGAMLSVAGILIQRLSANPMASPEILGISAGASLGLIALLFAVHAPGGALQLAAASIGALLALLTMLMLARRSGFSPERLVLTGIGLSTAFSALAALLMASGDPRMATMLAWMAGSTYGVGGLQAAGALLVCAVLLPVSLLCARALDVMPLGDTVARALGLDVARTRLWLLLAAAVLSAAATLIIGPISFVGLMGPHLARMARLRRPVAQILGGAFIGAALLVLADWIGRNVLFPYQMPAGLLATFVGGPYFLFLLWRDRH